MRTIKFRGWHKQDKKMFFVSSINFDAELWDGKGEKVHKFMVSGNDSSGAPVLFLDGESKTSAAFLEEIVLMQFTGLLDKNGKEIYEGSVIEHWNDRYVVPDFIPLDRSYQADHVLPNHDGSDDWMSMSNVDWEVIGNIYENPELLVPKPTK